MDFFSDPPAVLDTGKCKNYDHGTIMAISCNLQCFRVISCNLRYFVVTFGVK